MTKPPAKLSQSVRRIEAESALVDVVFNGLQAHVAVLKPDGTIVAVNKAWERFATHNQLAWDGFGVGANYLEVCSASARDCGPEAVAVGEGIRDVAAGRMDSFLLEYDCSSPSEHRVFQVRVTRTEDDGEAWLVVCHENITDAIVGQRRLMRRIEDQAHVGRLQTVGELSAGLAHELNQPLATIANYGSGLLRRLDGARLEEAALRDALTAIVGEANRAADIIRKMRSFTRSAPSTREAIDLNGVATEASRLLEAAGRLGQIDVKISGDAVRVWGDRTLLEQVFVNLIRNASEAIDQECAGKGWIRVTFSSDPKKQRAVTVIEDSGGGVKDGKLDELFYPFFTTRKDGTGLGLAISSTIIEAHRGTITVREGSAGLIFTVIMPLTAEEGTS